MDPQQEQDEPATAPARQAEVTRDLHARLKANRVIWGAVLLVTAVLLIGLNAYVLIVVRGEEVHHATEDLSAISDNLGDRIEQSLQVVEISLQSLILRYRNQSYAPRDVYLLLRQIEQTLPQTRAIAITDQKGAVIHSSRSFPPPPASIANREHIAFFLGGGRAERYLSGPSRNLVDRQWQLSLALPILAEGNDLLGIVTTVIDPEYFSEAFVRTASSHGDVVSLLFRDRLVARQPWHEPEIGLSFGADPLHQRLGASRGPVDMTFTDLTGVERIGVARRIYNDQLTLRVSRPVADVLSQWRTLSIVVAAISIVLLLLELIALAISTRYLAEVATKESELLSLNKRLASQTRRAERLADAKSTFLANMSHEIRTPLGGVLGYADLLLKGELDSERVALLRKLRAAGDQLLAVINDILDYSKLEAGDFTITTQPTALAPVIDEVYSMMRSQAEARGLTLRLSIAPSLPAWVETDPVRLRQILINLVGNAVKFTDEGSVSIDVGEAAIAGSRPAFRMTVADTGIGIPARKIASVFERFTQVETNVGRGRGGTGLGLSISRRLAELMGGSLTLASEEGHGTTVDVVLPLVAAEAPASAPSVAVVPTKPGRILVVDDLPMNLEIVGAMLRARGHAVATVSTGLDAVDAALIGDFDVILLDLNLPDIDGYEVAREIRKLEADGKRVPILAFSANALPEHVAQALEAGMDGHVSKPIDEGALNRRIAGILAGDSSPESGRTRTVDAAPLIDHGAVAALKRVLGEPRFAALETEFWSEWESFCRDLKADTADRRRLAARAHDMVAQAGNVGLMRTAEACRRVSAAAEGDADLSQPVERLLEIAEETRRAVVPV